jgi:hypothetical protein
MSGTGFLQQEFSLLGCLMQANSTGQATDVQTEVHDQPRNHDGPETNGQRDLVVRRLVQNLRHGNVSLTADETKKPIRLSSDAGQTG